MLTFSSLKPVDELSDDFSKKAWSVVITEQESYQSRVAVMTLSSIILYSIPKSGGKDLPGPGIYSYDDGLAASTIKKAKQHATAA